MRPSLPSPTLAHLSSVLISTRYTYAVWLYDSDVPVWDPNGILTWLAQELDLAERAGQRAWISTSPAPLPTGSLFRSLPRMSRRLALARLASSSPSYLPLAPALLDFQDFSPFLGVEQRKTLTPLPRSRPHVVRQDGLAARPVQLRQPDLPALPQHDRGALLRPQVRPIPRPPL